MLKKFTLDAKKWCRGQLDNSHGRMCALGQYYNQGGNTYDIGNPTPIWVINDDKRPLRSKVKELKRLFKEKGIKMLVKGL